MYLDPCAGNNILQYNGKTWNTIYSINGGELSGIWGSSVSNIFAVGVFTDLLNGRSVGVILHYIGSGWSHTTDLPPDNFLTGIWGSNGENVYVVGDGGTIWRYDGNGWSSPPSGTSVDLSGVWGSSATNVFAVGKGGTILHYRP